MISGRNPLIFSVVASVAAYAAPADIGGGSLSGGGGALAEETASEKTREASAPEGAVWFLDDFESGDADRWELMPGERASFSVVQEPGKNNQVLQYIAGSSKNNVIALIKDEAWAEAVASAGVETLSDYYVQARFKPQRNSTTGSKHLFFMARYQDADNWYLGGLNVQNDPGNTRLEVGSRKDGSISRDMQGKRPVVQGNTGEEDGQWYTVRLELIGDTLTGYLDGELIGSTTDPDFTTGKIGLYTSNKSFLIDDVIIGDPSIKPISLVLEPSTTTLRAEAGTDPLEIKVQARISDGVTADSFTVVSDDDTLLSVEIDGEVVRLTPLAEGVVRVTVTSGSNPGLVKVLTVTVTPRYQDSPSEYPGLGELTQPKVGELEVIEDTSLALTFDAPPTLTGAGSLRIFRANDNSLVDIVFASGESDLLGPVTGTNEGRLRHVNTQPIYVEGNSVRFDLHADVLEPGTEYYVGIADGTIEGMLAGAAFKGLGKAAGWNFTTRTILPTGAYVTVDDNGAADFRSVQGALNYVMQNVDAETPASIAIANGTYRELLFLRGKNNLTIKGMSRDNVVIEYENFERLNGGSGASTATPGTVAGGGRSVLQIENADLLTLDSLTIRNTHQRSGSGDQAETLYFNADQGRLIAKNANFLSEQDTIQVKGYSWFYQTLVEGNVDFIWGNNHVALFEDSEIRTVGDSKQKEPSGGYVLQARTVKPEDKGFVFLNSSLTKGVGPAGTQVADGKTYLARSGGNERYLDNITFINCRLDNHIADLGWAEAGVNGQPAPNPPAASVTSGWKEFGSMDLAGEPLDTSARSKAARLLTPEEAKAGFGDRAQIFSAFGDGAGWNPEP